MVRHQAVGEDLEVVPSAICVEQAQVRLSISVGQEDAFAVVTTLRDVMRNSRE
jgi:hypothetical protein